MLTEIQNAIDVETKAWNTKNVDLLLSVFHPDMVWFWPDENGNHDPMTWLTLLGRFNADRWGRVYKDWFEKYSIAHNNRTTQKITLTKQGDGAFAVVDIDTLWVSSSGEVSHWFGRTGKTYVKSVHGWKMINQVGVFRS